MNEPFLPLPLPSPPTDGFGPLLARLVRGLVDGLTARPAGHPAAPRRRDRTPILPPAES